MKDKTTLANSRRGILFDLTDVLHHFDIPDLAYLAPSLGMPPPKEIFVEANIILL